MTDKQTVAEVLSRLPEDVSIGQISEEIRLMAAVQRGREDVAAGRIKTHAEVSELLQSWSRQWSAK